MTTNATMLRTLKSTNKEAKKMNDAKELLTIVGHDNGLLAMFIGAVLSGISLISIVGIACVWYL